MKGGGLSPLRMSFRSDASMDDSAGVSCSTISSVITTFVVLIGEGKGRGGGKR